MWKELETKETKIEKRIKRIEETRYWEMDGGIVLQTIFWIKKERTAEPDLLDAPMVFIPGAKVVNGKIKKGK